MPDLPVLPDPPGVSALEPLDDPPLPPDPPDQLGGDFHSSRDGGETHSSIDDRLVADPLQLGELHCKYYLVLTHHEQVLFLCKKD